MSRRLRGFRTAKDLADAISADNVTVATIENLEAGRRADISVSQLLNIAMALRVPPVFLLVAVDAPGSALDLPNLSSAFDGMDVATFDAWMSGLPDGAYRETTEAGRSDRAKLQAARDLQSLLRERDRLAAVSSLDEGAPASSGTRARLIESQIAEVQKYLASVGWSPGEGS